MDNIFITLVNPSHPGNIGAVARAMKNMSLFKLRLVKPKCEVNAESYARSAGADDILNNVEFFSTLHEAIADSHLVIGTCARSEVPDVQMLPIREAAKSILKSAQSLKVNILFGREHAGLTNAELALCQNYISIPSNPLFTSLNLGAAVQIIAYELWVNYHHTMIYSENKIKLQKLATQAEIEGLKNHAEKTLSDLDFYQENNPRRLFPKLRALFNRTRLLSSEVAILRGILTAIDKNH